MVIFRLWTITKVPVCNVVYRVISKLSDLCLLRKLGQYRDLQMGLMKNLAGGPGVFLLQSISSYFTTKRVLCILPHWIIVLLNSDFYDQMLYWHHASKNKKLC